MIHNPSIENDIKNLKSFIETYWSKTHINDLSQLSSTWNQSLLNVTNNYHHLNISDNKSQIGFEKSMNDDHDVQKSISRNLILLETKNWLDLMTLTVDGTLFFVNLILACYFIYRICHVKNPRSNDVINSLILHKSLIGVIIGIGFTIFDVFLILSSTNNLVYKSLLRKIRLNISWSSLCFLKLNFGEIMTTCYLYDIIIMLIVVSKTNVIPQILNRQWKIFLTFLHGIPWIIVLLVQLLLYIVSTFHDNSKIQYHKLTTCNFLLRDNIFSLFFQGLLLLFPLLFSVVLLVIYLVKISSATSQSSSQNFIVSGDNTLTGKKCPDVTAKDLDFPNIIAQYSIDRSIGNSPNHDVEQFSDRPLILAVSMLLLTCHSPIVVTRLIMNVYWIADISARLMHFICDICYFIDLCLFSLHPLLVLIYTAWRDGIERSSSSSMVDSRRKSDLKNSYLSINHDEFDEAPLQGFSLDNAENLKYMMTSV